VRLCARAESAWSGFRASSEQKAAPGSCQADTVGCYGQRGCGPRECHAPALTIQMLVSKQMEVGWGFLHALVQRLVATIARTRDPGYASSSTKTSEQLELYRQITGRLQYVAEQPPYKLLLVAFSRVPELAMSKSIEIYGERRSPAGRSSYTNPRSCSSCNQHQASGSSPDADEGRAAHLKKP
jgi:hypothetical protein